jgi:hypothetical protein
MKPVEVEIRGFRKTVSEMNSKDIAGSSLQGGSRNGPVISPVLDSPSSNDAGAGAHVEEGIK